MNLKTKIVTTKHRVILVSFHHFVHLVNIVFSTRKFLFANKARPLNPVTLFVRSGQSSWRISFLRTQGRLRVLAVVVNIEDGFRDHILTAQPLAEIDQLAPLRTKRMVPAVLSRDMVFLAHRTNSFSLFFRRHQDPLPPLPSTTLNRLRLRSTRRRKRQRWNLSFH